MKIDVANLSFDVVKNHLNPGYISSFFVATAKSSPQIIHYCPKCNRVERIPKDYICSCYVADTFGNVFIPKITPSILYADSCRQLPHMERDIVTVLVSTQEGASYDDFIETYFQLLLDSFYNVDFNKQSSLIAGCLIAGCFKYADTIVRTYGPHVYMFDEQGVYRQLDYEDIDPSRHFISNSVYQNNAKAEAKSTYNYSSGSILRKRHNILGALRIKSDPTWEFFDKNVLLDRDVLALLEDGDTFSDYISARMCLKDTAYTQRFRYLLSVFFPFEKWTFKGLALEECSVEEFPIKYGGGYKVTVPLTTRFGYYTSYIIRHNRRRLIRYAVSKLPEAARESQCSLKTINRVPGHLIFDFA